MRTYISLKSGREIEGKLYFGHAYLMAHPMERIDLLQDWIADLQTEYEKQKQEYFKPKGAKT